MAVPKFTPQSYYSAAIAHLAMATRLHEKHEYFLAHYFAGVSVEAVLRALSILPGDTFDGTHSIEDWAKKTNLLPRGSEERQDELRANITEVNLRWRANQRYYTEKMLDTYLHHIDLDGKVRGNRVKFSSQRMLDLANTIVTRGDIQWKKRS